MQKLVPIALAMALAGPAAAQTQAQSAAKIDPAIQASMDSLEHAWNTGDGPAWGRAFWPDADSVNVYGATLHGGVEMGARHAVVFAGRLKGTKMKVMVLNVRKIGSNVAIVDTNQEVVEPARTLEVHVTNVLERRHGEWRIVHVQNTTMTKPPAD